MKKVLVDVNVVLDVLLDREPHVRSSANVWASAIEARNAEGLLAAHAVTTIHYLIRREVGSPAKAKRIVASLLRVFGVALVDQTSPAVECGVWLQLNPYSTNQSRGEAAAVRL